MSGWLLLREAFRGIARQKMRSGLSTLGIVISVAAVVAMQAIGTGASRRMSEQMEGLGTTRLLVYPGSGQSYGARTGVAGTLTEADAAAIRELRGVARVGPALRFIEQVVSGNQNQATNVYGANLEYLEAQSWTVERGLAWDVAGERRGVKSCLIGQTVAEQLFPGREPLGAIVRVGHMPCEVIGVLAPKGMSAGGLNQDDAVVMPLATARGRLGVRAAGRPGSVSLIVLTTRLPRDTSRVEQDVKRLLRQRHAIGPDDEDDFNVRNLAEIARTAQATVITIKTLLLVVALISLVVGGIGIMNIMLVSVTERTREIGIRLAIGATARDVLLQFLVESVVLTALGGAIGVTLGAIVAAATRAALGWRTELDPSVVLMAVLFSGGVGVVFGLIPSVRAARLDPIEALRHE